MAPRRGDKKGRNGKPKGSNAMKATTNSPKGSGRGSGDSPNSSRSPSPVPAKAVRSNPSVTLLEAPAKGATDGNEYRAFQMENGIRVLLISDENTKTTLPPWHHRPNLRHAFKCFASPTLPFPSSGTSTWAMASPQDTAQIPFSTFLHHQTDAYNLLDSSFAGFLPLVRSSLAPTAGILSGEMDRRRGMECGGDGRTVGEEHQVQGPSDYPLDASIAITVHVGAGDDPAGHQGLAHFCEHMVHYGSPKYPREDMHFGFFMNKGASMNAFTQNQTTTYTFSINPEHLEEGIERMSNMLASPLFKSDIVKREVQSVDNEFLLRKHYDVWKKLSILWSLPEDNHPLHGFPCGNAETLLHLEESGEARGLRDLEEALRLFHKTYYVGSAMTLTLQCPTPLDVMQKMVVRHFSEIPKGERNIRQFTEVEKTCKSPYDSDEFNRLYAFESSSFTTYMVIGWALSPNAHKDWRGRPVEMLEAIFNDQSTGSLICLLQKKNYIVEAHAAVPYYEAYRNDFGTLFEMTLVLTDQGIKNYEEVLEFVFAFIKQVKMMPLEEKERIHKELADCSTKLFEFSGAGESSNLTVQCSLLQQFLPVKEIFKFEDSSESAFNNDTFIGYLEDLSPNKMNVTLHISTTEPEFYYDLEWPEDYEPYFETYYKAINVPAKLMKRLENVKPTNLKIPPNPYASKSCIVIDRGNIKRQSIATTNKADVVHLGHAVKTVYRAGCVACFMFPYGSNSSRNSKLVLLLCQCIRMRIMKTTSLLRRYGTQVHVGVYKNNIAFSFLGFPESLPLAIRDVLMEAVDESIKTPFPQEMFDLAKAGLLLTFSQHLSCNQSVAMQALEQVMMMDTPSEQKDIDEFASIRYEELLHFTSLYFSSTCCFVEISGNASQQEARIISDVVNSLWFSPAKGNFNMPVTPQSIVLPHGDRCIRIISGNSFEVSSCILNLYQLDFSSTMKEMALFLGACMGSSCFSILRTEKQLGYVVQAFTCNKFRAPYLAILINFPTTKNTACQVDLEIDNFLKTYYLRNLSTMSLADFEYQKQRLELRSKLSLSDVVTWYKENILNAVASTSGRWNDNTGRLAKLSIQVLGYDDDKNAVREECCQGISRCATSQWDEGVCTEYRLYYASDAGNSIRPYFIDDIQAFRNTFGQ